MKKFVMNNWFILALATIMLVCGLFFFTGCPTPESLKQSAYLTSEGIDAARAELLDNSAAIVHLEAAKKTNEPVKIYLGDPSEYPEYSPEVAAAIAAQAKRDAEMMKALADLQGQMLQMSKAMAGLGGGIDMDKLITALGGLLVTGAGLYGANKYREARKEKKIEKEKKNG